MAHPTGALACREAGVTPFLLANSEVVADALGAETQGDLFAIDAKTGVLLNRLSLGVGAIDGGLITYAVNGKQFIAVAAGDNNGTYKAKGDNAIVILGLP